MTEKARKLSDLLADTWWFGLTQRLTEDRFQQLARLRVEQGFSACRMSSF